MIKYFKIFENSLYSELKQNYSEDKNIKDLIGFNDNEYELDVYNRGSYDFKLRFKEDFLTDFLDIEKGILHWSLDYLSNRVNDYYMIDNITYYLDDENSRKFNLLLNYLDISLHKDNYDYDKLFHIIDLIDKDDLEHEIEIELRNTVKFNIKEEFDELPFKVEYSSDYNWDIELLFDIDEIGDYIQSNNIEANTIKEFLSKIYYDDLCYEKLNNVYETSYNLDMRDFNKIFKTQIDAILNLLQINKVKDDKQLKMFKDEDLDRHHYYFNYEFFKYIEIDHIHDIRNFGGKLFAWLKSYTYQKKYITDINIGKKSTKIDYMYDRYINLKELEILNPIIKKEYSYLEDIKKYNL